MASRIPKEFKEINTSSEFGDFSVGIPEESNIFLWEGVLFGPGDSVYEKGNFKFNILFPNTYPFKAPEVLFTTKVFHPNINSDGQPCLQTLNSWGPNKDIKQVLKEIRELFVTPNPEHSVNEEAGKLYISNRNEFNKKAKEWVEKFANDF